MEVIYVNKDNRLEYLGDNKPSVMAIGFFDGVHLGHQQVIKEARKVAREKELELACMSFFPHPKEVLKREENKKVQYLMPMAAKQRILKKLGVKKFYIIQFNPEFASLTPKEFVKNYLVDFGVRYAVAGFDFTYGQFGKGNMDRIKEDSNDLLEGIKVEKVEFDGEKVSSTLIRKLISTGKVEKVHRYLGEHYQIKGRVLINKNGIEVAANPYFLLPPPGVYEVNILKGQKPRKQVVLVTQDSSKVILSNRYPSLLMDQQEISIEWIKRYATESFLNLEKQSAFFKEA